MNVDPFNPPTEAETRKEMDRLQDGLKRGILRGGKRVLGTFLSICGGLVRYALHHKIGHAQALDEAVMALPRMFPVKVTELRAWLTLCEQAGIPHVPATDGPFVSMAAIEAGTDGVLLGDDLTIAAAWIEGLPENTLWRWQCCAPEALKTYFGMGGAPMGAPRVRLLLDDRLLHIAWGEQLTSIQLLSRPYVQVVIDKTFPVEFRVFVSQSGEAVCSYYPQRPLSPEFAPFMELAAEYARKLAKMAGPDFGNAFTCDFILVDRGDAPPELMFLEGGPPHTPQGGAHPCCFAIDRDGKSGPQPGRRLLATEPGAQTHIPAAIDDVIESYRAGEIDFGGAVSRTGIPEEQVVVAMAMKGIVPREMSERLIAAV